MDIVAKEDRVYTPREVAAILRVSSVTVSRAIRDGKLRGLRVGGQWRILGSDLQAYLETETCLALGKPVRQIPSRVQNGHSY